MPFIPGDKIRYLNEEGGGVVMKELENGNLLIACYDGFEYEMKKSEVVADGKSVLDKKSVKERLQWIGDPKEDKVSHDVSLRLTIKDTISDYLLKSKPYWTSKDKDFIEIDLHLEELVQKPKLMNDGQKLHFQLEHAKHCLEGAVDLNIRRIVFIHGVGSGVLRHELRKWLSTLSYVEIVNANYHRYGIGATEARIIGSV